MKWQNPSLAALQTQMHAQFSAVVLRRRKNNAGNKLCYLPGKAKLRASRSILSKWLDQWTGVPVGANNSFKPKPLRGSA